MATTFKQDVRELKTILGRGDVRDAIIFLNGQTEHRFTALYRFDADTLHNLVFYDRENPSLESTSDIPVMASYCVFVRDRGETFATPDSLVDYRVAHHPKRNQIRSYCGVPLIDADGRMFGSICHFDFRAIPISDANVALMEAIAPALKGRLDPVAQSR